MDSAATVVAALVLEHMVRLPGRAIMAPTVAEAGRPAKRLTAAS
jgi:hypothetical protein